MSSKPRVDGDSTVPLIENANGVIRDTHGPGRLQLARATASPADLPNQRPHRVEHNNRAATGICDVQTPVIIDCELRWALKDGARCRNERIDLGDGQEPDPRRLLATCRRHRQNARSSNS